MIKMEGLSSMMTGADAGMTSVGICCVICADTNRQSDDPDGGWAGRPQDQLVFADFCTKILDLPNPTEDMAYDGAGGDGSSFPRISPEFPICAGCIILLKKTVHCRELAGEVEVRARELQMKVLSELRELKRRMEWFYVDVKVIAEIVGNSRRIKEEGGGRGTRLKGEILKVAKSLATYNTRLFRKLLVSDLDEAPAEDTTTTTSHVPPADSNIETSHVTFSKTEPDEVPVPRGGMETATVPNPAFQSGTGQVPTSEMIETTIANMKIQREDTDHIGLGEEEDDPMNASGAPGMPSISSTHSLFVPEHDSLSGATTPMGTRKSKRYRGAKWTKVKGSKSGWQKQTKKAKLTDISKTRLKRGRGRPFGSLSAKAAQAPAGKLVKIGEAGAGESSPSLSIRTRSRSMDGLGRTTRRTPSLTKAKSKSPERKMPKLATDEEKPFKCNKCTYASKHRKGLRLHSKIHNREELYRGSDEPPPLSSEFGEEIAIAGNSVVVKQNTRKVKKSGPNNQRKQFKHKCQKCTLSFEGPRALENHMECHNPEGKPFKCNLCSCYFVAEVALHSHKVFRHNSIKRKVQLVRDNIEVVESNDARYKRLFKCKLCDKTFSQRNNTNIHIQTIHWHQRPFACPEPKCSKSFARRKGLELHKLSHSGLKPHQCTQCQVKFNSRYNLGKHMKLKHPDIADNSNEEEEEAAGSSSDQSND